MKHYLTFLICFLVAGVSNWAQTAMPTAEQVPTAEENSLLWEISGNNLKEASYLFGTIHMIGKEDFFLTDKMKESFKKAKRVTFEIDMEEMSDFSTLMPLMMKAFMANGTSLSDLLSEEDYQLVKDHFETLGLPMMFLDRIKPMFLSAMTSGDMINTPDNPDAVVSYEMELMKTAQEQKMDIAGLESAEYQMSMFDSIPYDAQAEMLVESIKSEDQGDAQFDDMVRLYKDQDIFGMQNMLEDEREGIADYGDLLLVRRNRNWIPVMSEMMKENCTFFAVGAGHLGGQQGVIALLRMEGYEVKPLR